MPWPCSRRVTAAVVLPFAGVAASGSPTALVAAPDSTPVVGVAATPEGGVWTAHADGEAQAYAGVPPCRSLRSRPTARLSGLRLSGSGNGYWEVAGDGGIFSFGDAAFYGSTGSLVLNQPVVGMASTPDGRGYWLVAKDGGIFSFGDAAFYGSTGSRS